MSTYLPRLDSTRDAWDEFTSHPVDAAFELEAVAGSYDSMRMDPAVSDAASSLLVTLHGALLLFQVGGRAELLPSVSGLPFGRRFTERRIIGAARRMALPERRSPQDPGYGDAAYQNWLDAGDLIDELIARIDPDLAVRSVA